jgi:hypothetical protein
MASVTDFIILLPKLLKPEFPMWNFFCMFIMTSKRSASNPRAFGKDGRAVPMD